MRPRLPRRFALPLLLLGTVLLWSPLIRPLGAGAILVSDIYSSALFDRNVAAYLTPAPRVEESRERFAGAEMRVTSWVPAWGARHSAVLLVNGATALGNDDPETRRLGEALARAGYLAMLPEFPFLKEGTLDREAPTIIDAAFALLAGRADTRGASVGAFGFSVGGGMLLAAAARSGALERASYVGALGAYFDLDTYLASVVSAMQRRNGALEPWDPAPEARLRLPLAAAQMITEPADFARLTEALRAGDGRLPAEVPPGLGPEAQALWSALAATDYDVALARLRALPVPMRAVIETLSPRTHWGELRAPVYWLHDVGDRFEPVSEAEAAGAAARAGPTRLQRTELLSHAAALGEGARGRGLDFWATELSGLLLFAASALSASR